MGLCLLIGSLLNANMFGNIALIISEIKMKSNMAQEIIDTSNTAMKGIGLNKDLNSRIVNYIKSNVGNADYHEQLHFFFHSVSPQIKEEVVRFIFKTAIDLNLNLQHNSIFR